MSLLTVTAAATATDLTTLEAFKAELAIAHGDGDEWIKRAIPRASAAIATWCNRVFAQETLSEQFRLDAPSPGGDRVAGNTDHLLLGRWPVSSIAAVTEDGVALAAADYELDGPSGVLYRVSDDSRVAWASAKIVVAYTAGYTLPGTANYTLPRDIEHAALLLLKSWWFARTRDPLVKQESISGVADVAYWVAAPGQAADLPPDVAALLDKYRKWGHA